MLKAVQPLLASFLSQRQSLRDLNNGYNKEAAIKVAEDEEKAEINRSDNAKGKFIKKLK